MAETQADQVTDESTPKPQDEVQVPEGAKDEDAVKSALQAERQAAKEAKAQARELRATVKELSERLAEVESDYSSNSKKLSEYEGKVPGLEATITRYEIAAEKGLDLKLASRISGSSREEMEADADELKKLIGASSAVSDFDGGARDSAPAKGTPEQEHARWLSEAFGKTP